MLWATASVAQAVNVLPNYEVVVAGVALSAIVHHLYMPIQIGFARKKCVTRHSSLCSDARSRIRALGASELMLSCCGLLAFAFTA